MCKTKCNIAPVEQHGELEQVFENIWIVQGSNKMPMFMPMRISKTMTIVRNPKNNELTIVNSMGVSDEMLDQIEALGSIQHIVTIAGFHGKHDSFYREKYGATVYAIEGMGYSRALPKENIDPDTGYMIPDIYLGDRDTLPIPNAIVLLFKTTVFPEGVIRIEEHGGILITGDSLQNTPEADQHVNWFGGIMMKKFGFYHPYNVGPAWLQFAKPNKSEVQSMFLDMDFEHVLPGHGIPVVNNAKEKYRPVLEGELKGCHTK